MKLGALRLEAIATRNKKLLVTKGIATRGKNTTSKGGLKHFFSK